MSKQVQVKYDTVDIALLNPAPYNPRAISGDSRRGLKASMDKFGMVQPIIWNSRTGNVVGGHQRLTILREEGVTEVPVAIVDLSLIDEKALNLELNNAQITGQFTPAVAEIMRELGDAMPDAMKALRLDMIPIPREEDLLKADPRSAWDIEGLVKPLDFSKAVLNPIWIVIRAAESDKDEIMETIDLLLNRDPVFEGLEIEKSWEKAEADR